MQTPSASEIVYGVQKVYCRSPITYQWFLIEKKKCLETSRTSSLLCLCVFLPLCLDPNSDYVFECTVCWCHYPLFVTSHKDDGVCVCGVCISAYVTSPKTMSSAAFSQEATSRASPGPSSFITKETFTAQIPVRRPSSKSAPEPGRPKKILKVHRLRLWPE